MCQVFGIWTANQPADLLPLRVMDTYVYAGDKVTCLTTTWLPHLGHSLPSGTKATTTAPAATHRHTHSTHAITHGHSAAHASHPAHPARSSFEHDTPASTYDHESKHEQVHAHSHEHAHAHEHAHGDVDVDDGPAGDTSQGPDDTGYNGQYTLPGIPENSVAVSQIASDLASITVSEDTVGLQSPQSPQITRTSSNLKGMSIDTVSTHGGANTLSPRMSPSSSSSLLSPTEQ